MEPKGFESRDRVADPLYSYISRLDFYRDLKETQQSIKRNIENDDVEVPTLEKQDSANNVPLKFLSKTSYMDVWSRLFLYEARAQILKAKLEESKEQQRVEVVCTEEEKPFLYFIFKRLTQSKTEYPAGSLVILSPDIIEQDKPVEHMLGFIEGTEGIKVKLIFDQQFKQKEPEKWARFDSTKEWTIKLLCAVTTIEREFKALQRFPLIDETIRKTILNPKQYEDCVDEMFQIPEELDKRLHSNYNDSQYKAIHNCLKKQGITLIQGPPGTGKTRTVIGTLSVLLNSENRIEESSDEVKHNVVKYDKDKRMKTNPWFNSDFVDWRDQVFMNMDEFHPTKKYVKAQKIITLQKKHQNIHLPGKILICGPSNASVDEIIRKVLNEGLLDSRGKRFDPQLVRVGDNFDPSLANVSLDYLALQELTRNQKEDIVFYRNKILRNSKIVCATLSAAGHQFIDTSGEEFDTVVVDEACQAVQISTLIPLVYGCKRLILIGDPNQLPSTVFSRMCIKQGYDQSLFERMMRAGYAVNVLKVQYRMHPDISKIVGGIFYGGVLQDSPQVVEAEKSKFSPFIFLHVPKSAQSKAKLSFKNVVEGKVIKYLSTYLFNQKIQDVGVLSPYSQQIEHLKSLNLPRNCEIKTIDSFQGRQKNVVIFNTVRAGLKSGSNYTKKNKKKTIGFLSDRRRINVGLSRAKHTCFVVGDAEWLHKFPTWREIIQHCLEHKQLYEFKDDIKDYFARFTQDAKKFLKDKLQ